MKKKELYEAPSVETYDLILENNVLQTGSPTNSANNGYVNNNDLGEIGGTIG